MQIPSSEIGTIQSLSARAMQETVGGTGSLDGTMRIAIGPLGFNPTNPLESQRAIHQFIDDQVVCDLGDLFNVVNYTQTVRIDNGL